MSRGFVGCDNTVTTRRESNTADARPPCLAIGGTWLVPATMSGAGAISVVAAGQLRKGGRRGD
eukprot:5647382-Amphidinium_carterae.3